MKTYDPNLPLFSIHIPKCAGSSFSEILKKWFKNKYLRHYHNEKRNRPPKKHKLKTGLFNKKYRYGLCIHGHFNSDRGNGVLDYYPEATQMITVIRDPFELHISTYFYVKREAKSKGTGAYRAGKPHRIIENGWSLEDYLKNMKNSYIRSFLPSNINIDNYHQILEDQFLHIGISDQLQLTVDILSKKLGFQTIQVPRKNISERLETPPNGSREEFEANNPLEFAIYRFAKYQLEKESNIVY